MNKRGRNFFFFFLPYGLAEFLGKKPPGKLFFRVFTMQRGYLGIVAFNKVHDGGVRSFLRPEGTKKDRIWF